MKQTNNPDYTVRPGLKSKVVSKPREDAQKKQTIAIQMTDGVLIPNKSDHQVFNSWRITFFLAIALLAVLILVVQEPYREIFFFIIRGAPTTFQVTILAIIGALFIGLFAGLGSVSKSRVINMISGVYVEFIRGIPLLVQLIFIYYAMGRLFRIEGMTAAVIALSICFGAYMGEIVRAGIQAIPKGQMEAAIALGLSRGQSFRSRQVMFAISDG
jgi:polar amino acid transport system permease protein